MKIIGIEPNEVAIDIRCDGCGKSTKKEQAFEHATISASWGYESKHDGEHYELHLCELCFYSVLGNIKELYRVNTLFDD